MLKLDKPKPSLFTRTATPRTTSTEYVYKKTKIGLVHLDKKM